MVETIGSNIEEFNAYVKQLRNLLAAGGGTCDNLQYYLIEAYKQTGDIEFTTYIRQKELAWKDGTLTWDRSGTDLMSMAESYYRDAKANDIWLKVSAEQTKIIAFEAQLKLVLSSTRVPRQPGNTKAQDTKGAKGPRTFRESDAWKLVAPSATEGRQKMVNKKTYNWCNAHNMWTIHSAAECRLNVTTKLALTTLVADESSSDEDSFADDSNESDVDSNTD
jgi:hypothetical protein